jgi:hypothetical protein
MSNMPMETYLMIRLTFRIMAWLLAGSDSRRPR